MSNYDGQQHKDYPIIEEFSRRECFEITMTKTKTMKIMMMVVMVVVAALVVVVAALVVMVVVVEVVVVVVVVSNDNNNNNNNTWNNIKNSRKYLSNMPAKHDIKKLQ